jgi:hypothetical protein
MAGKTETNVHWLVGTITDFSLDQKYPVGVNPFDMSPITMDIHYGDPKHSRGCELG